MARGDLDWLQQQIHYKAELNVDVPSSGDDDYTLRTALINQWIENWENEEGMLWDELYAPASITVTGASNYSLLASYSNMKRPGGWVRLEDSSGNTIAWYPVKKPNEIQNLINSSDNYAYFLGDEYDGYTLYFNPHALPTSGTIKFSYYKKATRLSTSADNVEMSDPLYIVHGVVSDIYSTEDPGESDKNFQIAQNKMKSMKIRNIQKAWYQENNIPDRNSTRGIGGFGL